MQIQTIILTNLHTKIWYVLSCIVFQYMSIHAQYMHNTNHNTCQYISIWEKTCVLSRSSIGMYLVCIGMYWHVLACIWYVISNSPFAHRFSHYMCWHVLWFVLAYIIHNIVISIVVCIKPWSMYCQVGMYWYVRANALQS